MINQFLLQSFSSYVDPFIEKLCGGSKAKEYGVKVLITACSSAISYAVFGPTELGAKVFHSLSSVICGSVIMDSVSLGLNQTKSLIADKLDHYGYDKCIDLTDSIIDIVAGVALRQTAGLAISLPNITPLMQSKAASTTDVQDSTKHNIIHSNEKSSSLISSIFSGLSTASSTIFNLGRSTQYSEENLISNSLDMAGGNMLLNGGIKLVTNIGGSIWNIFSRSNQSELSVYDIKDILRTHIPSEDYNRTQVKAQADEIFVKIQRSDKYIESFNNKPEIQEKIHTVTDLYIKNLGTQLKSQYGSALSDNPKLLEQSEVLVEKLMELEVTNRLLNARESFSTITQFNEYGIEMPIHMKPYIKQAAEEKLIAETKIFEDITDHEKIAYKSLFLRAAEIEIEFDTLSNILAMQQEAVEESPEFA